MKMNIFKRYIIPALVAVVAIAFIAVGVMGGENNKVLNKATAICLECIGIG